MGLRLCRKLLAHIFTAEKQNLLIEYTMSQRCALLDPVAPTCGVPRIEKEW